MNSILQLSSTREKLLRLQYKPEDVAAMVDSISRILTHFADPVAAAKALEKGFCEHANWRFSSEQFERFLDHINPHYSMFYRDWEEEDLHAPLSADDKLDLTQEDIAEFEAERTEYRETSLRKAQNSWGKLETELAFDPLFGAHYRESKRPQGILSEEPQRRPGLVFTPQGGQPGFHRRRRNR